MMKIFPIEQVRAQFPALQRTYNGKQVVYMDGPGGSQIVIGAIKEMEKYLAGGGANLGGSFPTSIEITEKIAEAKSAVADLFNAKPSEVAFGPNATTMMFNLSRAISRDWKKGDEIVLTELEHHSNIDTWRLAAEEKDVIVKYIPLNLDTLTLDMDKLPDLVNENTKLIAVGTASNCIGTITDLHIAKRESERVGAILATDAVHAIPHFYVDMKNEGIDLLFCSVYKMFGPHVGMAVINEDLIEKIQPYKIVPSPNNYAERFETGTQNHEGIPGVTEAIKFIASLGEGETFKEKIKSGYKSIEEYEDMLANKVREELAKIEKITMFQAPKYIKKTPTIAFNVEGISPANFTKRMSDEYSIFIADGDFYARTLAEKLGIDKTGGFIRAGLAPYNTMEEVNKFIKAVKEIVDSVQIAVEEEPYNI